MLHICYLYDIYIYIYILIYIYIYHEYIYICYICMLYMYISCIYMCCIYIYICYIYIYAIYIYICYIYIIWYMMLWGFLNWWIPKSPWVSILTHSHPRMIWGTPRAKRTPPYFIFHQTIDFDSGFMWISHIFPYSIFSHGLPMIFPVLFVGAKLPWISAGKAPELGAGAAKHQASGLGG